MSKRIPLAVICTTVMAISSTSALAHDQAKAHTGGIQSKSNKAVNAPFDIVHTKVTTEGNIAVFHMAVSGKAGASKPAKSGKLAGRKVFSYVWPTSLDPSTVGFEAKAGILAFAVTSHPDFDDTPLFDENGDGNPKNEQKVEVRVPFDDIGAVHAASFDGVTAALRVNASAHEPLLCVENVFKIGSGNLSLPGKVNR